MGKEKRAVDNVIRYAIAIPQEAVFRQPNNFPILVAHQQNCGIFKGGYSLNVAAHNALHLQNLRNAFPGVNEQNRWFHPEYPIYEPRLSDGIPFDSRGVLPYRLLLLRVPGEKPIDLWAKGPRI